MMKAKKSRAISSFSFQSASAIVTTPTKMAEAIRARRAVSLISTGLPPLRAAKTRAGKSRRTGERTPPRALRTRRAPLPEGEASQRGRRSAACPRARIPPGRDRGLSARVALPARGKWMPRRRGARRAARRVALGPHARGCHDREAVRRRGDTSPADGGGPASLARVARPEAEPHRQAARLRNARGGAAGGPVRPGSAAGLQPGRAPRRVAPVYLRTR